MSIRLPVGGGLFVEVEASRNIVLVQERLNTDDVLITLTNVKSLILTLDDALTIRDSMQYEEEP